MRLQSVFLALFNVFLTEVCYFVAGKHWIPKPADVVHNVHIGHKDDVAKKPLTQNLRYTVD